MKPTKKVTVQLPERLLRAAQESTGEGVTATIRRGLELVVSQHACADLRKLRRRLVLSLDLRELREDRR